MGKGKRLKEKLFTTTKFGIPLITLLLVLGTGVAASTTTGYVMLKLYSGDKVNVFGYVLNSENQGNITINAYAVDENGDELDISGDVKLFYDNGSNRNVLDSGDSLVKTLHITNGNVTTEVSKEGTYFVKYINFGDYSVNYTAIYTEGEAPSLVRELNVTVNAENISCTTTMAGTLCTGGKINGIVKDWNEEKIHAADVEVRVEETGEILQDITTTSGYYEVQVDEVPNCDWSGDKNLMHFDVSVSYSGFEKYTNTTFYASNTCG